MSNATNNDLASASAGHGIHHHIIDDAVASAVDNMKDKIGTDAQAEEEIPCGSQNRPLRAFYSATVEKPLCVCSASLV